MVLFIQWQCTCDATRRHLRATNVAVEKQYVLHIVCVCVYSLSYAACNAHAPYCHLCPSPFYSISPHYLINDMIFKKKKALLKIKYVFWFFLQLVSEAFPIIRRSEPDMFKMCVGLHVKYRYFCSVLMKLEFYRQIYEKISNQVLWKSF